MEKFKDGERMPEDVVKKRLGFETDEALQKYVESDGDVDNDITLSLGWTMEEQQAIAAQILKEHKEAQE